MLENYSGVLAIAALFMGSIMSLGYIPQAYKMWKRKSVEDISITLFIILFMGITVWLLYGLSISNTALIIANTIGVFGTSTVILFYFKYKK